MWPLGLLVTKRRRLCSTDVGGLSGDGHLRQSRVRASSCSPSPASRFVDLVLGSWHQHHLRHHSRSTSQKIRAGIWRERPWLNAGHSVEALQAARAQPRCLFWDFGVKKPSPSPQSHLSLLHPRTLLHCTTLHNLHRTIALLFEYHTPTRQGRDLPIDASSRMHKVPTLA